HHQRKPPTSTPKTPHPHNRQDTQETNQARSLRTQQCTAPHPKHHPHPHKRRRTVTLQARKQVISIQTHPQTPSPHQGNTPQPEQRNPPRPSHPHAHTHRHQRTPSTPAQRPSTNTLERR